MSALPTATEALIKELAATTTSFKTAQDELLAEMAPEIRKGWAARANKAIEKLETAFKGIESNVAEQIAKIRRTSFDARGNYRGVFGSEQQARSAGLFFGSLLGSAATRQRFADVLKGEFPELHARATGTLDTTHDDQGGTLVPAEFYQRILDQAETYGVALRKAFRMPMGSNSGSFPSVTSDPTAYFEEEGVAPTASNPGTGLITLNVKGLKVLTYISDNLSADAAVQVGELVARSMARSIAKKVDQCVFIGDGSSTYANITGIGPKLQDIDGSGTDSAGLKAFAGHDAYSEVTAADLDALMGLLPEYADADAEWYCHRKALFGILFRLERAAGGVTAAEMEGRRRLLYGGYPINVTQAMSGSEADETIALIFGALNLGVTWGDRGQFSVMQSEHYKFPEGLITVLGKIRLALNVHGCGTSSVAGPLVAGELETST